MELTVPIKVEIDKEMLEKAYRQGRADERAKLLAQADCKNAECWNCAMADRDMNCMLKEHKKCIE